MRLGSWAFRGGRFGAGIGRAVSGRFLRRARYWTGFTVTRMRLRDVRARRERPMCRFPRRRWRRLWRRTAGLWRRRLRMRSFAERRWMWMRPSCRVGRRRPCLPIGQPRGRIQGEKGYQPLNFFLAETGSMLCSEMRDGNVPAREGNARVLSRALELLPEAIEEVMIRSDSAGTLRRRCCSCAAGRSCAPTSTRRFGVIGFAISAVRSQELMAEVARVPEAEWTPLRVLGETNAGSGRKAGACRGGFGDRGHRGSELRVERGQLQQARRDRPATSPSVANGRMRWASTTTNCRPRAASRPTPSAC